MEFHEHEVASIGVLGWWVNALQWHRASWRVRSNGCMRVGWSSLGVLKEKLKQPQNVYACELPTQMFINFPNEFCTLRYTNTWSAASTARPTFWRT